MIVMWMFEQDMFCLPLHSFGRVDLKGKPNLPVEEYICMKNVGDKKFVQQGTWPPVEVQVRNSKGPMGPKYNGLDDWQCGGFVTGRYGPDAKEELHGSHESLEHVDENSAARTVGGLAIVMFDISVSLSSGPSVQSSRKATNFMVKYVKLVIATSGCRA